MTCHFLALDGSSATATTGSTLIWRKTPLVSQTPRGQDSQKTTLEIFVSLKVKPKDIFPAHYVQVKTFSSQWLSTNNSTEGSVQNRQQVPNPSQYRPHSVLPSHRQLRLAAAAAASPSLDAEYKCKCLQKRSAAREMSMRPTPKVNLSASLKKGLYNKY